MDNTEIVKLLNRLDTDVKEIKDSLNNCVTENDMRRQGESIYKVILKQVKKDISALSTSVGSNVVINGVDKNTTNNESLYYTKEEIDGMNFITEHQSLKEYATIDYVKKNYINMYDIHGLYLKCVREDSLNDTLKNYISNGKLELYLSNYVTKEYMNTQIESIRNIINNNIAGNNSGSNISDSSFVTKKYVENLNSKLLQNINNNYLTKEKSLKLYWTRDEQSKFEDYADRTFMKKVDYNGNGYLTVDDLEDCVKKIDLSKYVTFDDITDVQNDITYLNSFSLGLNKKINSLQSSLNNTVTKDVLLKNYLTKEELNDKYLSLKTATSTFLKRKEASDIYLTKHDAKTIYLAIEDYKSLKNIVTINDTYRWNEELFYKKLDAGELKTDIYILGDTFQIVKNGYNIRIDNRLEWLYRDKY